MSGPQRECVEAGLGLEAWHQLSRGERNPTPEEDDAIRDCLTSPRPPGPPPLQLDAPLPQSPPDEKISITVGPVTITTYNPVTITGLETSTNLYFVARNGGDQPVTLRYVDLGEMGYPPVPWIGHLFWLQAREVRLPPGAETTIEFMLATSGEGGGELPFRFRVAETGHEEDVSITLRVLDPRHVLDLPPTAAITGQVTGTDGQPVPNAAVELYLYNGREAWRTQTDPSGFYYIAFPSIEDLQAALGPRPLPYRSLDYFLVVDAGGYLLGYYDDIAPVRGETVTLAVVLQPVGEKVSYGQIAELSTGGVYGYWWLLPNEDFSRLAGVQARHPPELNLPGHFLMTDLSGQELWRIATDDECWGFDLTADGRAAAGCHNGAVYLADGEGHLVWQVDSGGQNREVEFSPDGVYLLTGPYPGPGHLKSDAALLDAATGEAVWTYVGHDEWLRTSRWSPDGERVIAGFSGGRLVMFTREGKPLWESFIGEFPMVLEIDADYTVYAAGKNRELFSFDADGNLRWRHRIPNHVVTAGSNNMSADGKLIVFGTVGGWLYAFDDTGQIIWQRSLPPTLQGHNALDMTPDGQWIAAGTAGFEGGWIGLYDRKGTLVWSHQSRDSRDPSQWPYEFDHNQTGAIAVAISDDAKYIAAGYGDSVIRIFEQRP